MAEVFGLDFGTTNSLACTVINNRAVPVTVDGRPHPSVVQFTGEDVVVGAMAKQRLGSADVGVVGNIVRSPKRYLGAPDAIPVGGVPRTPVDLCAPVIDHVRRHATEEFGASGPAGPWSAAVMTIPVGMDGRGRRDLRAAARRAGVEVVQFVHEPLAALYGWFRRDEDLEATIARYHDRLVLVFDWGGGTLDLTLCRISRGVMFQIANFGDETVGGDEFDKRLVDLVLRKYQEANGIANLPPVQPGANAKLLEQCEAAKISLSSDDVGFVVSPGHFAVEGPAAGIAVTVTKAEFEEATRELVERGIASINRVLRTAGVEPGAVELVLTTGGMNSVPAVRRRLLEIFDKHKVPPIEHGDHIIAEGAAWIAHDERPLTLAKPFEIVIAPSSPAPLIEQGAELIGLGVRPLTAGFFCVDPTDGFAKVQFVRPQKPMRAQISDDRLPYATMLLPIDATAPPFRERLTLRLTVDPDLVVSVSMSSDLTGVSVSTEIHELEFGLGIGAVT